MNMEVVAEDIGDRKHGRQRQRGNETSEKWILPDFHSQINAFVVNCKLSSDAEKKW